MKKPRVEQVRKSLFIAIAMCIVYQIKSYFCQITLDCMYELLRLESWYSWLLIIYKYSFETLFESQQHHCCWLLLL